MSDLILDANAPVTPTVPHSRSFRCLNGPCQGSDVDAPSDTTVGNACALPWKNIKGSPRFAVYVVVDYQGTMALMYLKSYDKAFKAQQRVREISAICAVGILDG